ncbi:30S ribosomal protein S9 [Candidatus Micrarchaeota archaeon]|nr:30S ribosomal protein S9 [Candidatus Micrarchaeota archaeon]
MSKKTIVARGKRKRAVARAAVRPGTGIFLYNDRSIESYPQFIKQTLTSPMELTDSKKYDVQVSSNGGGMMGQAQAARTAVAKALVEFEGDELKKQFVELDRSFLVEDPRRVEPKKFKGPKARARFTKSYR